MKESIQTLLEEISGALESSAKLDCAIEERLHPILEPTNPNIGTVKDARGNPLSESSVAHRSWTSFTRFERRS